MKVLILGTGRCGTLFSSRRLRGLGWADIRAVDPELCQRIRAEDKTIVRNKE